jgi:hypothetical protein
MQLKIPEVVKDVVTVLFLVIVVALMADQGGPSATHTRNIVIALLCTMSAVVYVCFRVLDKPSGTKLARWLVVVALIFGAGFLCGLSRAFADGWDRADVALVVPALMSSYLLKIALTPRPHQP